VPGAVTFVKAGSGGGSGEIMVWWDPVADSTGYRVYRSDLPDGPFVASASFDVATGTTTIEYNHWYEYIVISPSWPQGFAYVDAIGIENPVYFRVTAFNAGGEGPRSVAVCGRPIGFPPC
jgi:hypothetical protein